MNKKLIYIGYFLPLIIFLTIVIFFWKGLQKDPHEIPSVLVGKSIPEFSYVSLMDKNKSITNKVFLGQVSLLNVWATWCLTCYAEHSILMDIMKSDKVVLFGLNYKDDGKEAENWMKKYGNPYKAIIFDPKGQLAIDLGVYGTPETFVIDKKGIIRYKHIGAISPNVWKDKLQPLIEALNHES